MWEETVLRGRTILEITEDMAMGCSGVPLYMERLVAAQAKVTWDARQTEIDAAYQKGVEAGEVTAYHNAFKAGKKEGVWVVTEWLINYNLHQFPEEYQILFQQFLKGLEG